MEDTPILYMLSGPACVGKSTFRKKMVGQFVLVDTDSWIEEEASRQGKTYNEIFVSYVHVANGKMMDTLKNAVEHKQDIIWDQTCLTHKTRENKLRLFKGTDYRKIGIFFIDVTKDLIIERNCRPGKIIPGYVIEQMVKAYEVPAGNELGPFCPFDEMWFVSAVTGEVTYRNPNNE